MQVAHTSVVHAICHPICEDRAATAALCVQHDSVSAGQQGCLDKQRAMDGMGQMRAGLDSRLPASTASGTHLAGTLHTLTHGPHWPALMCLERGTLSCLMSAAYMTTMKHSTGQSERFLFLHSSQVCASDM